jgi:hypothetical protein
MSAKGLIAISMPKMVKALKTPSILSFKGQRSLCEYKEE